MAIYRCKTCGAQLNVTSENKIVECDYCGTTQTLPKTMDENTISLFNRATTLLQKAEYDKAESIYEKILTIDSEEPEAYWGLILCKYGIEYVEDPKTFKKIPTCHRSSYDSVIADEDYKNAIKYADISQKILYEEEAKVIDEIQKGILEVASKEEPYDIFISYKETDENGRRTVDSGIANDIYYQLTNEGYKVFYSAISLEDKLGKDYEPIIFSALHSSKVMLVVGTKPEYINAPWVKNEWSRFLKIMKNDRTRLLIPCYKNIDPYELPDEFAHLQAQDMGKIGFVNDLVRGIKKVITKEEKVEQNIHYVNNTNNQTIEQLLKRVFIFLEDQKFEEADEYCEKVLDIDAENGQAYLGKLLSEFKIKKIGDIEYINYYKLKNKLKNNLNLLKIYKYCDQKTIEQIKSIIDKNSKILYFSQKDIDAGDLEKYLCNEVVPAISFDSSVKEIKKSYFEKANKFKKIIIPSSVSKIEDSALDSIYIKDICVNEYNNNYASIDGNLYSKYRMSLIQYAKGKNEIKFTIPSSVTKIAENAFAKCKYLVSIVIPSNLKSIGNHAFIDCENLKNVYYNGTIEDWCKIKFSGENSNPMYYATHFYMLDNEENYKEVTEIDIPNIITQIGNFKFYRFNNITKITIPSSVTYIGDCAFSNCASLKKVYYNGTIEEWCNISFSSYSSNPMYYATHFYMLDNEGVYKEVTEIEIPDAITSIGKNQFYGFNNISKVTIPSSVTYIGDRAFYNCTSLKSISVPKSVRNVGTGTFIGLLKRTKIYCEANFEMAQQNNYYPTGSKPEYWSTYILNFNINSIIEVADFEYQKINDEEVKVINYLGNSKNIILPQSIILNDKIYAVTEISIAAFENYIDLESITIPSSVKEIGYSAFKNCTSLESIVIPSSITSIGAYAFLYCNKLTIYCETKKRLKTWDKKWNQADYASKSIPVVWKYKKK